MKNLFYYIVLLAITCFALHSCSTGAYEANPSSPANQSINPLNPLKANQFTWSGSGEFSAVINGSAWVADTAWVYLDTDGVGNLIALQYGTNTEFYIHYPNSWGGIVYNMGYEQVRFAEFIDSLGFYSSVIGNSGELYVTKVASDTLIAKFYFQGVSTDTSLINVTDGYINIQQ